MRSRPRGQGTTCALDRAVKSGGPPGLHVNWAAGATLLTRGAKRPPCPPGQDRTTIVVSIGASPYNPGGLQYRGLQYRWGVILVGKPTPPSDGTRQ